ncbi:MAG: dihydrolipoyl dehydrogenase [Acidobacteriota bacterium]
MVMGSLSQETDVLVIGAGPGGYVAALRAADLGREVIVVEERDQLGGVCLIEGCIPSKALIHSVEVGRAAAEGRRLGVVAKDVGYDLDALRRHKQQTVRTLTTGVRSLLDNRNVEVVRGRARFTGPNEVRLEGADVASIRFRHAIVATGSRVASLPFGDDLDLWTSTSALEVPEVPKSLLVIGGGYIGLELGFVYAGLGSKVTVVEMLPQLLTGADPDLAAVVAKRAKKRFEDILLEAKVTRIAKTKTGFSATIEQAEETSRRTFSRVLVAVGRKPNTDDLGLDAAGVTVDERGLIPVDEGCRTSVPHIFAIGDVTPGPMLAHRASRQAKVAAEVIAGHPAAFDNVAVPAVVFTEPELAWVGLTEQEAREDGRPVTVGKFPLSALGRARAMAAAEGLVKVIAEPETGLLLGVGIVGPHASDLIAEGALALEMGATLEDLAVTIHPHPTLSEALMEAAEVALGSVVHLARRHG